MQQLGLQRRLHLPDFVEHQRAGVGLLELADARFRAGERAGSWPNSSLSSSSPERRAVHLDERPLRRVERW